MDEYLLTPVYGMIDTIEDIEDDCCGKIYTISTGDQIVRFRFSSSTYVIDHIKFYVGMQVVFFYDTRSVTPLIYPPQYDAVIAAQYNPWENIMVDYFDDQMISYNQTLRINLSPCTEILSTTGQDFNCPLPHRLLIVIFKETTRSLPAQTIPDKIIVFC